MAAFREAADAGADLIELDVRLTLDRHAVVIHDRTLRRTTGTRGTVERNHPCCSASARRRGMVLFPVPDHLSQGQINGFPTYRLKDAGILSAQQRFVGCVRDTRAETFKPNSDEFKALELYVASRGNGLMVEGVSVRH